MKKKIYSVVCLSFMALTIGFETANACSGLYLAASAEQAGQIADDALANCCAGSVIYISDLDGNVITQNVEFDGPNSSCAQD